MSRFLHLGQDPEELPSNPVVRHTKGSIGEDPRAVSSKRSFKILDEGKIYKSPEAYKEKRSSGSYYESPAEYLAAQKEKAARKDERAARKEERAAKRKEREIRRASRAEDPM